MKSISKTLSVLISILLLSTSMYAYDFNSNANPIEQRTLDFTHFGAEEGLSQGTIYCIFQDSRGYLWFGTQYGLNRYDGYSYKVYINDPKDSFHMFGVSLTCTKEY